MLCPVAILSDCLILQQEDDSPHRRTLCTVLIVSRLSLIWFNFIIFLFSFEFRVFLVLYAERGLVKNGQPNLHLFYQLFWIVVVTFVFSGLASSFGGNLLKGNFLLQDLNRAKACLLGNMPNYSVQIHFKKKAIIYAFISIGFFGLVRFKLKVRRFISGLCPNGRMSCVGNFKRNVINLNQTFLGFVWWCFAMTFCCISIDYGDGYLSAKTQFWIWNLSGFLGYEGMQLFLPFLLDVPSQGSVPSTNPEFYVRKPNLEPRIPKYSIDNVNTNISKFIYTRKYEPKPEFSQRQAPQSNCWLVKDILQSGELDDIQESSSHLHMVSGAVFDFRKDFSDTSKIVIELTPVDC